MASVQVQANSSESTPGRVLVVGCNMVDRHILTQFVRFLGIRVEAVASGHEALRQLETQSFDLVLLDLQLPDIAGQDLLRMLKASPDLADVPIVMISDQVDTALALIPAGAEDYIIKPFRPALVCARVRACLDRKRLHDREGQLKQELADRNQALEETHQTLHDTALRDALTGLPNRRAVLDSLKQLWAMQERRGAPLACLMVGVDGLQAFTHDAADAVLRESVMALQAALRISDLLARYGPEAFLVLCPDTDLAGGRICAQRIQESVRAAQLSVSIGVAESRPYQHEKHFLRAAEHALQAASIQGPGSVIIDRPITL